MQITIQHNKQVHDLPITINDECNHGGAEEETLEFASMEWDNDSHGYLPTGTEYFDTLFCHNCDCYLDSDGFWVQDN